MITITDLPKPPVSTLANHIRADRISSLGILDRLPPEILSILLGMLDIQSISHFERVSFRGNTFVQSHRAYQDLVRFAPHVLLALGRVGLIRRRTLYRSTNRTVRNLYRIRRVSVPSDV